MAALIGALRVSLSADTAAFAKGMTAAERKAKQSASVIQKSFTGIKTAAAGMLVGLNLAAFTAITARALDYASSLGEVSQQLGVTTKDLQTLRYAASQMGVSQEELDKSLGKLTVTLGQVAAGAKAPTAALKAIGIEAKDVANVSTGEAFRMIADGLQLITNRSERAAVEVALFGRTGAKLDTMLAGGSGALNGLADAAEKLGIVMSDEQIQSADDTADKLAAVKMVLEANIASAVANNASAILSLVNALAQIVTWAGKAANAWTRWKATQGIADEVKQLQGFQSFTNTPERKALARQRINAYQNLIDGTRPQGTPAFAQGSINSLDGFRGGGGSVPGVSGMLSGGGGGGRGKSAEQIENERIRALRDQAEALRRFTDDTERQRADIVSAMADLTGSIEQRAESEIGQIDADLQARKREIDADEDLSAAQREELKLLADDLSLKRIQKVEQEKQYDLIREASQMEQSRINLQEELLGLDSTLARTAAERREIELRILDLAMQRERAQLEEIKATNAVTSAAYQEADARLGKLGAIGDGRAAAIRQGTQGPLEEYLDRLPKSAAEAQEALERVQVDGIDGIVDGLAAAATGAQSLGSVFKNVANQIVADLLRIQLQKAIVNGLSSILGGGSSNPFAPVFGDEMIGTGGSSTKLPGMASGGGFRINGSQGYDTNLLSINGQGVARVNHGEQVTVTPANDRGSGQAVHVTVDTSPLLTARIDQGDAAASETGTNNALKTSARMNNRRIG